MPAQATIHSKTLNQHIGRKQIIPGQTQFKQYPSIDPALQRILERKLKHKEGTYTKEKTRY